MSDVLARLMHMSDLHFGTSGQPEVWTELTRFIREQLQPNVILITGDIVNTPRTRSFTQATTALTALAESYPDEDWLPRVLVCPGNHDRFAFGNRFGFSWPW